MKSTLGLRPATVCVASIVALAIGACGGGGGSSQVAPPPPSSVVPVSQASALNAACGTALGVAGTPSPPEAFTANSAVQPQLVSEPTNALQLFGVWEQDRWDAIGARALNLASSNDGGATWSGISTLPFAACGGGSGPGASFDRASDPSVTVGSAGAVFVSALAFSAAGFAAVGGRSAVLVVRSTDGGKTWPAATAIIDDTGTASAAFFNDRDAIAADPASGNVYIVWDRSDSSTGAQPAYIAQSADNGLSWSAPRILFDPGAPLATFNNQPLVLPGGAVVDVFTLVGFTNQLSVIASSDHGASWSGPVTIATMNPAILFGVSNNPISGGAPFRDSPLMAQTAVDPVSGTLAAVWQESSFSAHLRDGIALALSLDGGRTWSTPVEVNAVPAAAAFDPSVHFGAGGTLAVTYYDTRNYLAGSTMFTTDLWLREFSINRTAPGSATATREVHLFGPFNLNFAPPADQIAGMTGNALFLGDQQGLAWNGSGWTSLFAASPTAAGARVFAGTAP